MAPSEPDAPLEDSAHEDLDEPDAEAESRIESIRTAADLEPAVDANVSSAADAAIQRGDLGPFVVSKAVDAALTDAAKRAVVRPDISEAISAAVRRQAGGALATDPALLMALQREPRSERAPAAEPADTDYSLAHRPIISEGSFSAEYSGPGSFFAAHEAVIDSFDALAREIQALVARNQGLTFVWRGQGNADWGLHSSLYRRLMYHYGVVDTPNSDGNEVSQRFPDEADMLGAELSILGEAMEWRMAETPALELFARLQHHGGPSRLLDVTRNPLIAAWFAVEVGKEEQVDARLFALATNPVARGVRPPAEPPVISDVLAGSQYPFWTYESPQERTDADWGTGARRRIWIPPAYDARIAAQNAAFLLEGVPMLTRANLRLFRSGAYGHQWTAVDVAASMSIYARPVHPHKHPRATKSNLAPMFSFRITAKAKAEIRAMLDRTYGFTTALLYPDIQGMSSRLQNHSDWINAPSSDPGPISGG